MPQVGRGLAGHGGAPAGRRLPKEEGEEERCIVLALMKEEEEYDGG